jgi:hypothetical protein
MSEQLNVKLPWGEKPALILLGRGNPEECVLEPCYEPVACQDQPSGDYLYDLSAS